MLIIARSYSVIAYVSLQWITVSYLSFMISFFASVTFTNFESFPVCMYFAKTVLLYTANFEIFQF